MTKNKSSLLYTSIELVQGLCAVILFFFNLWLSKDKVKFITLLAIDWSVALTLAILYPLHQRIDFDNSMHLFYLALLLIGLVTYVRVSLYLMTKTGNIPRKLQDRFAEV